MERNFCTFVDWSTYEVSEWLTRLTLSRNYTSNFLNAGMDGSKLLKINQAVLDHLNVMDHSDRIIILQEVTNMRATLTTNPKSLSSKPVANHTARHPPSPDINGRDSPGPPIRSFSVSPNLKEKSILKRGRVVSDHRTSSPAHRYSDTPPSNLQDGHPHSPLLMHRKSEGNVKGILKGSGWPLVEVLREENSSLRKDLGFYHKKARKLQKLEQEIEAIREAHQLLEVSTQRREILEKAMRKKLEEDLKLQKEQNLKLQVELQVKATSEKRTKKGDSSQIELERRDSVIVQLLRKQRESLEVREQLEEDLLVTRAQLSQKMSQSTVDGEEAGSCGPSHKEDNPGGDDETASASNFAGEAVHQYLSSIETLRGALRSIQESSHEREQLQISLRERLESEVEMLRGILYSSKGKKNGVKVDLQAHSIRDRDLKISALLADVAKLEHKYLEVSTDHQIVIDSAVLPRDAMIANLERVVKEQGEAISELRLQKMSYIEKLYGANKRVADLESRVQSMQATITEKGALIQTLQEAFTYTSDSTISLPTHSESRLGGYRSTLTRATSSDDILLNTLPPSPGRRRRIQTDQPDEGRSMFELGSPHRMGSLMRAASTEHILSECRQPRSIPVKGVGGSGSTSDGGGGSGGGQRMKRSLSNDGLLLDRTGSGSGLAPRTHPLVRKRGKSVPEEEVGEQLQARAGSAGGWSYGGRLGQRVKSCDTGLDEQGVSRPSPRPPRPLSMVVGGAAVRVLSVEKKRLSTHFLDTLAKATSIDSLSSCSSSARSSPVLPSTPRFVHRFSAISPNTRKKSPESETAKLAEFEKTSSLPAKFRSASLELLDSDQHYHHLQYPGNDHCLSDGELEDGGVDLRPRPPTTLPIDLPAGQGGSLTLSSLVTQRMTVKTGSLSRLPLTAWTTAPDSPQSDRPLTSPGPASPQPTPRPRPHHQPRLVSKSCLV